MSEPLLDVRDVHCRFGGVLALDAVSFSLRAGEIYGLIGPNGAGKTTLFDVITGFTEAQRGRVFLDGVELPSGRPHVAVARGLARTFQNIRLFRDMTVLDNVRAGAHLRQPQGWLANLWAGGNRAPAQASSFSSASLSSSAPGRSAQDWLEFVGLLPLATAWAGSLSYGDQRRLEIARALATGPRLLALDEPAAGMNATETEALRRLIERIRDEGVSVLLIEHDVGLVFRLCDRVLVLDAGRCLVEDRPQVVRQHPEVLQAYLGSAADLSADLSAKPRANPRAEGRESERVQDAPPHVH